MGCGITASVTTNWLIYGPGTDIFDPTLDPSSSLSALRERGPAFSPVGTRRVRTPGVRWAPSPPVPSGELPPQPLDAAGEPQSAATNAFALRALVGSPPVTPCSQDGVRGRGRSKLQHVRAVLDDREGTFPADPQCPEIHGDKYMGIYVDSGAGGPECDPGTRYEQSAVNTPAPPADEVMGQEPCASFYLAQVAPSYAGKTMTITLFDPGRVPRPSRYSNRTVRRPAFTYQTDDTNAEEAARAPWRPTAAPPTSATTETTHRIPTTLSPVSAIPGTKVPNLAGRTSASKYNDRYLEIQVPITSDLAVLEANGGWYKVQYVFASASVSDRTTWSVTIGGNPIHLIG